MEQLVFLVLVAVVGLLRLVMQAAERKRNNEAARRAGQAQAPSPNRPLPRAPAQSEEERIRKFMEALGVPTNAPIPKAPPRKVVPKTQRPARKIMPVDPFPTPRVELPQPIEPPPPVIVTAPALPPSLPPLVPTPTTATSRLPLESSRFEVAEIRWDDESSPSSAITGASSVQSNQSWRDRLGTPESVRDAIVLREIFGAPRSLRQFDLTEIVP